MSDFKASTLTRQGFEMDATHEQPEVCGQQPKALVERRWRVIFTITPEKRRSVQE